jgi:hemerythrin-like domain-containing protein
MTDPLDTRTGLPDALRVLLAEYPRAHWADDPGYHGLVSFWLERHMMFRRILDKLSADTRAAADRKIAPQAYAQGLARLGSMFVGELHGHHGIEDAHYFPVLAAKDARLAEGFALLDRDHHDLDGHLNRFVEQANALLQGAPAPLADRAAAFHDDLARLERFLDRHLIDEEELVVPVVLKHGAGGLG